MFTHARLNYSLPALSLSLSSPLPSARPQPTTCGRRNRDHYFFFYNVQRWEKKKKKATPPPARPRRHDWAALAACFIAGRGMRARRRSCYLGERRAPRPAGNNYPVSYQKLAHAWVYGSWVYDIGWRGQDSHWRAFTSAMSSMQCVLSHYGAASFGSGLNWQGITVAESNLRGQYGVRI
jgi:hypothetical protein